GPFQSHMWWTSALWNTYMPMCTAPGSQSAAYYHSMQLRNNHSEAMYPIAPLILEAEKYGFSMRNRMLALGGGGVNNTGNFFADEDIYFGFRGDTSARTEVMNYGDFHATLQQQISAGQSTSGNILKMSASQGSPFVFFTAPSTNTAEPTFFLFFLKTVAISSSGNSITINRSCCPSGANQGTWGYISLFFPPGTTISNDGTTYIPLSALPLNAEYGGNNRHWRIKFPNPAVTNYFTAAIMSDSSQAALNAYEQYAFNHITASTFSYVYNEASATLTSTFNFTTTNVLGGANNGTLMALYPHQYLYSPDYAAAATPYAYTSSRGLMRVMTGNQFTTVMKNYGILPGMGWANTANVATLNTYINNYATRGPVNIACGNPVYGSFGSIHEAARIALIAHQAGNYTARNNLLTIAKNGIQAWLTSPNGQNAGMFHYDASFNWLTPYPSAFDADRLLQDSHFHHGYLIFAAAIVAKFEPAASTWAAQWGPMIELAIRNINSELRPPAVSPGAGVPWIPYLRYYDPYHGHSWAGSDASNQESVSEAINFAAGVAMWGETTGNNSLRDMGLMMFITETEAARMYWWDGQRRGINNGGNCGYAPNYGHYHGAIVGRGGVAYATYFGANVSYVHGITYVPITGASIWMGADSLGAANQYADFIAGNGGAEPNGSDGFWHVAMLMEKAVFNAAAAKNQFVTQAIPGNWAGDDYDVDGYSWITTFDSVGVIDPTVTANTSSFAVFRKNNCKHYMIYNPRIRGVRTVTFSDGQSFVVPADTIITYKVCNAPLPVTLLDFDAEYANGITELKWTTVSEINSDRFEIERSTDGINFSALFSVKANGNTSSISNYFAKDENPLPGVSYYRLKMVDQNGQFTYSKIAEVITAGGNIFITEIYPNPMLSELVITFFNKIEQNVCIELFTILGEEVYKKELPVSTIGINILKFNLENFASGTYLLKVTGKYDNSSVIQKVVKQ
ncbi:MAG: T9SS type A sorting domain-containing protein, partial [Cytophagaceae bacterium]|nr:T9SS type A sorting domain-containing protein [Cytophagaceae bacterium]